MNSLIVFSRERFLSFFVFVLTHKIILLLAQSTHERILLVAAGARNRALLHQFRALLHQFTPSPIRSEIHLIDFGCATVDTSIYARRRGASLPELTSAATSTSDVGCQATFETLGSDDRRELNSPE
jgi:hypothetical protein